MCRFARDFAVWLSRILRACHARDPDRLIKWFIGAVVAGVGVNLLSGSVVAQKWAWLPPAVFAAALLVAVPGTGLLRRERYRTTRARDMACLP